MTSRTPAIFLDKDGTLLCDVPYNVRPERMAFEAGVEQGLATLARLGWPLIVVSNQPGVALGLFDIDALGIVQQHLARMFEAAGANLTAMYYCPHRAGADSVAAAVADSLFPSCTCRKPAPGLLLRAAAEHGIDLSRSWMVGDILNDVEAGSRAGCHTMLVHNGNETEWVDGPDRQPTLCTTRFDLAAQAIVSRVARTRRSAGVLSKSVGPDARGPDTGAASHTSKGLDTKGARGAAAAETANATALAIQAVA